MVRTISTAVFCAYALLSLDACAKHKANGAGGNVQISSAESAAPASIAHLASIVAPDARGNVKTLRAGSNDWTCMPDTPSTPGPDPMCWDQNAGKWLDAYMGHKTPPANVVGVIYMLAGGSDPGNTDPYAARPHQGEDWVTTGPHVMIVGSKEALSGYPGGVKPNTAAPYAMWGGSPYAHLMVPIK